ncbi:MAG: hypothetical protein ACLULH_10210 [Bacteroides fragilis]
MIFLSNPARKTYYKTFSSPMQRILTAYCQSGGNLLVSGSYIGSDMSNSQGNREFTEKILKYGFQGSLKDTRSGQITGLGRTLQIPRLPNEKAYAVTAPDCIVPVDSAFPVFVYQPGQYSAGIAYKVPGIPVDFPFYEASKRSRRAIVMAAILKFFGEK